MSDINDKKGIAGAQTPAGKAEEGRGAGKAEEGCKAGKAEEGRGAGKAEEGRGAGKAEEGRGAEENGKSEKLAQIVGDLDIAQLRQELPDSIQAIAAAMNADCDGQVDLLSGSPDLEDVDLLTLSAKPFTARRKGAGRPKGSANRRNSDVFRYLEALGHRDPAVTLSTIQTADTVTLARMLGCKFKDALQLQIDAAKVLMPYAYSKKPQQLDVSNSSLHMMIVGELQTQSGDNNGNDQGVQIVDLNDKDTLIKGE